MTNQVHKTEIIALLTTVSLIFIFYVLTIREGHTWGGDFALYIQHALNIATGLPYTNTGYVVNPIIPSVSPYAYPPVFPFILTPVIKIFGLNLYAFKITLILILCITLILFHRLITTKIDQAPLRIFTILLIGLSPWYWDYKDHVLSEFPFILFFISFLLVTEKYLSHEKLQIKNEIIYGLSIGLLAYLAYGCRSIGIILIPVFIVAFLFFRRQIRLALILSAIIFSLLYGIQNSILSTDANYASIVTSGEYDIEDEIDDSFFKNGTILRFMTDNIKTYFYVVQRYWDNGFSLAIRIFVVFLTTILFGLGLFKLIRIKNISEFMFISYIGLLLVVPFNQGSRYLLPLLPFYLIYIIKGTSYLKIFKLLPQHRLLSLSIISLLFLSYLGNYIRHDSSSYEKHVEGKNALALYQFVNNRLLKTDMIAFRKPRILSLYTHAHSFSYDPIAAPMNLWRNFKEMRASHLLTANNVDVQYAYGIKKLIEKHSNNLEPIYNNEQFTLYKILSY